MWEEFLYILHSPFLSDSSANNFPDSSSTSFEDLVVLVVTCREGIFNFIFVCRMNWVWNSFLGIILKLIFYKPHTNTNFIFSHYKHQASHMLQKKLTARLIDLCNFFAILFSEFLTAIFLLVSSSYTISSKTASCNHGGSRFVLI